MPERSETTASDPHGGEGMVGPHGSPDDHGDDGGHDDHGHDAEPLGPLDVQSWGAAAGGVLLGLLVVLALIQALS
jgi:hypothetical protein